MNRRDFNKTVGLLAATVILAPTVLAEEVVEEPVFIDDTEDWDKSTPAQRAAIKWMGENMPNPELFREIASEFPQVVPDGTDKKGFQHGAVRMMGMIGGYHAQAFELGTVPTGVDLSDIAYVALYRIAVRNKYTSDKPKLFVATVPLDVAKEVNPGVTIPVAKRISIGTSEEEIKRMARESFAKLQELVVEYYNREPQENN